LTINIGLLVGVGKGVVKKLQDVEFLGDDRIILLGLEGILEDAASIQVVFLRGVHGAELLHERVQDVTLSLLYIGDQSGVTQAHRILRDI